jgi:PBP1b-binding outer membrane lipoprotein LpoB
MKPLILIFSAVILAVLLNGCLSPEEQEDQTNQRRYDAILKQNQKMIDRNQQKIQDRQNQ